MPITIDTPVSSKEKEGAILVKSLRFSSLEGWGQGKQRWARWNEVKEQFGNKGPLSYFIKEEDTDHVKIGMVSDLWNLETRLSSLQSGTPHKLIVIGITTEKEKNLHRKFAHLRVRGEWFEYGEEIKSFLKETFIILPKCKSMECPSCNRITTFRQERLHTYRYGHSSPIVFGEDGGLSVDSTIETKFDVPTEPDTVQVKCDYCHITVSLADIKIIE